MGVLVCISGMICGGACIVAVSMLGKKIGKSQCRK